MMEAFSNEDFNNILSWFKFHPKDPILNDSDLLSKIKSCLFRNLKRAGLIEYDYNEFNHMFLEKKDNLPYN